MAQNLKKQGYENLITKNYRRALFIYKKHLRSNPKDYEAWNNIGITYYYLGDIKRAIIALRKAAKRAKPRSQNRYFQGLCYDVIRQPNRSRRYLLQAANAKDTFGALAIIELAGFAYDERDFRQAAYWAKKYLKRFPSGSNASAVRGLLRNIKRDFYIPLKFTQRNQYQESQYKHHALSLMQTPHSWIFQSGFEYVLGKRTDPARNEQGQNTIKQEAYQEMAINLTAGLGLGPIVKKDNVFTGGYLYHQNWYTSFERVQVYLDAPEDINYFPLRPDLLERSHQIYGEAVTSFKRNFDLGLYGHIELVRSGSDIYPAPERPEIKQSINVKQGLKLIPWIKWRFSTDHSVTFYLLMAKEINYEEEEFSFQTYALFTGNPFLSYGLGYNGSFLKDRLRLYSELYNHRKLTNDYWEEYTRLGVFSRIEYRVFSDWTVMAKAAYYQDTYELEQIQSGSCQYGASTDSREGINCARTDTGYFAQMGLNWRIGQHDLISAYLGQEGHSNPRLPVYDEEQIDFYLEYSLAFPSIERAGKYMSYFERSTNPREPF